jgi:hypothetical protein
LKIEFPLLDTGLCLKLGTLAREADYPDVLKLLDAVHGKAIEPVEPVSLTEPSSAIAVSDADCAAFDAVVTQINEYALAHRFGIPIDSARGSYSLDASTVPSREAFLDLQEAFYIHLQNWINDETGPSPDTQHARSEVIGLMDEAFKDQGGHEAAYARARDGTQGGLRSVLDTVAEQYKRTCYSNYVRKVFYETVSVMEWDQRVRFMQGAMERLRPFLPPELRDEPPERFVRENGAIVKCYVESLDRLNRVFRTL